MSDAELAYDLGVIAGAEMVINRLAWQRAVTLAIKAGQISGIKQGVFKDPRRGWTWRSVE